MNDSNDITTDILVSAIREKLNFLLNSDNSLDSKAGTLFASTLAVIVFILSSQNNLSCFLLIAIILLITATVKLFKVLNIKNYNTGVVDFYNNKDIDYRKMNKSALLEQLLSDYQKAFDENLKILEEKSSSYKLSMVLFSIAVGLILFSFLI